MRGESVRIGDALAEMLANQAYSPTLKCLLGEFAAAAVLISNNLKYDGRIILQARSDQAVSLVMVECSSERHIRGIAQGDISAEAEDPMSLLSGGQLVLTVERDAGQRYQGIIALEQGSLAQSLEVYFSQSEQLGTRFWLASDGRQSGGLMLQQLPAQITDGAVAWRAVVYPVSADRDSAHARVVGSTFRGLVIQALSGGNRNGIPTGPHFV